MSHLVVTPAKLPMSIEVLDPDLWLDTAIACEIWNEVVPCFNIVNQQGLPTPANVRPDARVIWGEGTWVYMIGAVRIIYVSRSWGEWTRRWWLRHELGHLIGFGDHLPTLERSLHYLHPELHDPKVYEGIMSYVSLWSMPVPRLMPDDVRRLRALWETQEAGG